MYSNSLVQIFYIWVGEVWISSNQISNINMIKIIVLAMNNDLSLSSAHAEHKNILLHAEKRIVFLWLMLPYSWYCWAKIAF